MSVKMIVTDLDDTLLRTDKTVTDYTLEILNRCRAAGIKLAYATGRGQSAEELAPAGLFDGKITMNGAVARVGERVVYERRIPYEAARSFLMAVDAHGLKAASQLSDMDYANFDVTAEWPLNTRFETVVFSEHRKDAEKIYVVSRSADDAAFIRAHLPRDCYLSLGRDRLAMVMHRDATKSQAVAAVAAHWGIDRTEIAAFGDDVNDVDMLRFCGTAVAVANAVEEVKAAAGFICGGSNGDGPAHWLEEHVL